MTKYAGSIIGGIGILAVVYMLVRPGMPSHDAVTAVSDALTSLTKAATGWEAPGPENNQSNILSA